MAGEPGNQELTASDVVKKLEKEREERHESKGSDSVQATVEKITKEVGGDRRFQNDVETITSRLDQQARRSAHVDLEGRSSPDRFSRDMADIELQGARARLENRKKKGSGEGRKPRTRRVEDPMVESARQALSQPWRPGEETFTHTSGSDHPLHIVSPGDKMPGK